MKPEQKRYMLVEYYDTNVHEVSSYSEFLALLHDTELYNRRKIDGARKKGRLLYGNVHYLEKDGKKYIVANRYHKLTDRMTISELDRYTSQFTKEEFIETNKPNFWTNMDKGYKPDINVAYLESKDRSKEEVGEVHLEQRVKYIPVMYKEDMVCFNNPDFIRENLYYFAKQGDIGFFKQLANEFCEHRPAADAVEKLFQMTERCQYEGLDYSFLVNAAMDLYRSVIYDKDKDGISQISVRRKRDFVFFIRKFYSPAKFSDRYNYPESGKQEEIPEGLTEGENSQLKLKL